MGKCFPAFVFWARFGFLGRGDFLPFLLLALRRECRLQVQPHIVHAAAHPPRPRRHRWLHIKAVDDDCCLGRCCCGWFFWPCQGADSRGGHKEVPNWRDDSASCNNMLILTPGRRHPASLQTIDDLHTMLGILTDDATGGDIPKAHQPQTRALSLSRGIAPMCPGAPPLVAEYLKSVYTWEDHQSSSSSRNNTNRPPPPEAPPLILQPSPFIWPAESGG